MPVTQDNSPADPLPDRFALGLRDDWPLLVTVLVDLENSPGHNQITLRILRLALEGYSFREIGKMLGMSHNTAIKKLKQLINGVNHVNRTCEKATETLPG
jgi:hypothetical protein